MQDLFISSAKLTGSPDESGWAQVHEFKPEDEEKTKKRGHLFAVVSTGKQKDGVESVAAGRELLSRLHEEYFGKLDISAFNGLKRAVEKVSEEFAETWGGVEVAAIAVVDSVIYSAAAGGATISIFRKGILAPILKSTKGEVISASGHPQEGDLMLLASSEFSNDVNEGVVKAALESGDPENAVETFAPMVHAKEDAGSVAACVVRFGEEEKLQPLEVETKEEKKFEKKPEAKEKSPVATPSFFKKVGIFAKDLIPERGLRIKRSEVDVENAQKKRLAITTGVILLVLLLVSIVFGVRQKRVSDRKAKYEERLSQARHELDEAKSLFSLNPERARELFASSSEIVSQLEEEGVEDSELAQLKQEIAEGRQGVLGEHDVGSSQFLDIALLNDTSIDELVSTVDEIYILDRGKDRIVEVEVETKKTETFAGPAQISDALSIAAYEGRVFVVEEEGIFEVGNSREEAVEKEWDGEILAKAYAANLYILGKEESMVWRYAGTDAGFADQDEWLAPGIEPELSGVISMAIDGSIWILTESGNVEKYTRGNAQPLADISSSPPMLDPRIIYTNEELENVYILDQETARVLVFDKEGNYVAQYKSDVFRSANGLFVSESLGKIIVSSEDKLHSVDLAGEE